MAQSVGGGESSGKPGQAGPGDCVEGFVDSHVGEVTHRSLQRVKPTHAAFRLREKIPQAPGLKEQTFIPNHSGG